MPGFNRTGPEGKGPRTGRGLGRCNPDNKTTNEQLVNDERPLRFGRRNGNKPGKGLGLGNRRGRGTGRNQT